MSNLRIFVKTPGCEPCRLHPTDAGLDLKADKTYYLGRREVILVKCGIHVEIPKGHTGLIFPRSGLATKHGVTLANNVGVIDSDYRGEIMCAMRNTTEYNYIIHKHDRIAQLVIVPILIPEVEFTDELTKTDRGAGGFGHTGK